VGEAVGRRTTGVLRGRGKPVARRPYRAPVTSPSYCAPCIADLALVREAMTTVAGTASCMAHAVLLTHSSDDPGRRRQRLDALRDLANGKAENADQAEQVKLELLVQEYGLAGAMDMGGPARRAPQPRQQGQHGQPSAPGEGRKSRRGRPRPGDRPAGEGGERGGRGERRPANGETAPVTPAPGAAGEGAPVDAVPSAGGESSSPAQAPAGTAPAAISSGTSSDTPAAAPPTSDPDA
jgi:hypothetical protein